jgi:TRAP-type C4-dicarboxylate transport system permease small subunit
MLPGNGAKYVEAFADLFWIAFNFYFVCLSLDFIFNRMNKFWKAQTLGIEMKYFYLVLPIAFTLMAIRVAQVHYRQLVKGVEIADPDAIDLAELKAQKPVGVSSAA